MQKSNVILPTIVFVALSGVYGYHVSTGNLAGFLQFIFWVLSLSWLGVGMFSYIMHENSEIDIRFTRLTFWSGAVAIAAYIVGSWLYG